MDWGYLVLYTAVSAGAFCAGYGYAGLLRGRLWVIPAIFSLAGLLFFSLLRYYPSLEYRIVPLSIWNLVEVLRFTPFAIFFLAIAVRQVSTAFLAGCTTALTVLVFIYGLFNISWTYTDIGLKQERFRISEEGFCVQSTGFTCGAASAVSLLRLYGIITTEIEMSELSHTGFKGVNLAFLAKAISLKVGENRLKTEVISANWETISNLQRPFITDIKFGFFVDHVILVLGMDNDSVSIVDPLYGCKSVCKKKDFLEIWRGTVIVIR